MCSKLQDAAALLRGDDPRYSLSRRLTEPQSRSGLYGENKNIFILPGIELRMFH